MYPELFKIPFTQLTVKSYGLMIVIAFLLAVYIIRTLSKNFTSDPDHITNAALYALLAGLIGARIFYVIHYWEDFKDDLSSVFAIWQGGLELLGGVILAIAVIVIYLMIKKLPVRMYLDVLAIGLMAALAVGRIGCFLNGCCFGKPADVPWAVSFPYGSLAYRSQVKPDLERNREGPCFELPETFFDHYYLDGSKIKILKEYKNLNPQQKQYLTENDKLRSLPVHPTQLYSSLYGLFIAVFLFLFWKRGQKAKQNNKNKFLTAPGSAFAIMFILYSIARFSVEFVRGDNPFEYSWWAIYKGGTISQNLVIYLFLLGTFLLIAFQKAKAKAKDTAAD